MKKDVLAWALCAVPLIGVVELVLHVKQTTSDVVSDADWAAAREAVKADAKPEDLVIFAPFWADPVGRRFFGDELAGIKREARPDESRFPRAFEVGIHGEHRPELAGWKKASERQVGKITIGVYENPAPAKVLTDLVDQVTPQRMSVVRVDGAAETPCVWQRGIGQPGGLGVPQGLAVPADKFVCNNGHVGVAVLHALDHHPHLCIVATPPGGAGALRIKFANVTFGTSLHGHSGVQWVNERTPSAERIYVSFSAFERPLGQNMHRVGAGWTGFEFPTPELAGKRGELVAEITQGAHPARIASRRTPVSDPPKSPEDEARDDDEQESRERKTDPPQAPREDDAQKRDQFASKDPTRERRTDPPSAPRDDDAQKQDEAASTKKAAKKRPAAKVEAPAKKADASKKDDAPKKDDTSKRDDAPTKDDAPKKDQATPDLATRATTWLRANPDPFIGGGIAAVYVAWLLATARSLGFSRDEGFYFTAAYEYKRWFQMLVDAPARAIDRASIDAIWANNHEHPSLMKSLFAISHTLFHEKWRLFEDDSTAFRFPGMLMMGLALWVTYMFATRAYSRRAGVVAAIALGLMPNVFYHAHLACFDVPIMAMWVTCIYVYWRAEKEGGLGWALAAGVVYGLTLETKHNAWMLPAVFLPHAFVVHGKVMSRWAARSSRIPVPVSLVAMATVGPAVFILLWPWLWNDTVPRIQEYVNFHVHHDYYNIEFLGQTWFGPPSPRSYMPVMIAATVPTITLVLFLIGAIDRKLVLLARFSGWLSENLGRRFAWPKELPAKDRLHTDLLIFLGIAVALGPFLLPRTPIFGGTKHWITAYPFMAMLAGRGFDLVWTRIEAKLAARATLDATKRFAAEALVVCATFGGALATTIHSHPFGLSAYVPFFGGTAGGADLGLNRQFWGFTTESLAPWLAANAKSGETLYFMDTAWPSWDRLIKEKRIPETLRGVASPADAELSIVHHEQHMNEVDYNIWTEYRSSTPVYVLTHDGVPIITVYRRARSR